MSYAELIAALEMGLIYSFVSLALVISFRIIDYSDLTCDGSFVLGACVSSILIFYGCNPWLALAISFLTASCAGFLTAILQIRFKITDILSGILVAFMLYSINLKVLGGSPNISLLQKTTIFTQNNSLLVLGLMILVILTLFYAFLQSDIGLALRAVGQNKKLAQNVGIVISNMTILALMLSNGLIGLSGALFSQHQGFCDISQGVGTIIVGFAGIVIGEKILFIRSSLNLVLLGVLGAIVYRLVISIALHVDIFGIETQDLNLITGLLIIIFMNLSVRKKPCLKS